MTTVDTNTSETPDDDPPPSTCVPVKPSPCTCFAPTLTLRAGDDTVGVSYVTSSTNTTLVGAGGSLGVDTSASADADVFKAATYIMAVITVVTFLFTLLMIRRIMIAVACLKVGSGGSGSGFRVQSSGFRV